MGNFQVLIKTYRSILEKFHARKKLNLLFETRKKFTNNEINFYQFLDEMNFYNSILFDYSKYINKTDISKIEIEDEKIIFHTRKDNIKIIFDGTDMRGVPFEKINFFEYEKDELEIINQIIVDDMIILDIGANIGWYSMLFGKKYPKAFIYAFEPISELYRYCLENINFNDLKNVNIFNIGLSNFNGKQSLYFSPETAALSSNKNIIEYKNMQKEEVVVKTLDSFINEIELDKLDFIKCDVEGAELNVILGALNSIKRFLPVIFIELFHEWSIHYDYHPNQVINIFHELGYLSFIPNNGKIHEVKSYVGENFSKQNYFFLHKIKHKNLIEKLKV
ncbi:MAG: hypothetical protein A3F40_04930 [Chlamydiae bacterium RIFCSPHIGHO2_12_FULL_27_8]|nr:MAG: hypothetical protein A3F40_04930 [Chlamydiae bacterium RIFCSPHIGHO2_12_FULL_27_8]